MKRKTVAVAMSGGVDSSVAAALLVKAGYEVVGITMCFNLRAADSARPACCGAQGIADARRVCDLLGIRHHVFGFAREMERQVIADFVREYSAGRTPNPCVRCNERLKFDALLKKVSALGIPFLATGHYAKIVRRAGRCYLAKAADSGKDQSYFLYRLAQDKLARLMFPLGGMTKTEVRASAAKLRLPVADKKESQEICFIPGDYRAFLEARGVKGKGPGEIRDIDGTVLGRHRGLAYYTIGQRNGLGIARGYPVYVAGIDARNNRIVVGGKDALMRREFTVGECVFPSGMPKKRMFMCRIRHLSREAKAKVSFEGETLTAKFAEPQFAITPGQSAVFYDGDMVRCGGIITQVTG